MNESSYDDAMRELLEIKAKLQSEELGIDQLSTLISRAKELINFCKLKLRSTEEELQAILGETNE